MTLTVGRHETDRRAPHNAACRRVPVGVTSGRVTISGVLLAYLDESSSDGRYYIGAIVVHESNARALTEALDRVAMDAVVGYQLAGKNVELHAHELVHAKGMWAPMAKMHRARIGIFEDVLRAIVAHDAQLLVEGVHLARLQARYSMPMEPHDIAMNYITERINEHAKSRGELALMIADEVDHRDEHRRNLWVAQRSGTWGYKSQTVDHIVDTLHFAPSHSTRLLQAADVATFLYRRRAAHTETDPRSEQAFARLYAILQPNIAHARCWPPAW